MLLYQRTDCPFCWKVRLAIAVLELDCDIIEITLGQKHPDVPRLSPTGSVPILVDNEMAIWESAVILEYLDQRYGPRLFSVDAAESARIRLLHTYSDKSVGPSLRDLVFEKRSKPESAWDREIIQASELKWSSCLDWLEKNHLTGKLPNAADCALAARFGVAEAYGAAVTGEHPRLSNWYRTFKSQSAWQAAYPVSFIQYEQQLDNGQ